MVFNLMGQSQIKLISAATPELDIWSVAKVIFGFMVDEQIAFQYGLQRNTLASTTMNISAGSGTTYIKTCTSGVHPLPRRYLPWRTLPR